MAYATEVDRRRKSSDSSNSPKRLHSPSPHTSGNSRTPTPGGAHHNPPQTSGIPLKYQRPLPGANRDSRDDPKDYSMGSSASSSGDPAPGIGMNLSSRSESPAAGGSRSMLSMKFKGAAASSYGRRSTSDFSPPRSEATTTVPVPQGSGGSSGRVPTPGSSHQRSKSPLPGENLPEHHPKKRYFAETRYDNDPTPVVSSAPPTSLPSGRGYTLNPVTAKDAAKQTTLSPVQGPSVANRNLQYSSFPNPATSSSSGANPPCSKAGPIQPAKFLPATSGASLTKVATTQPSASNLHLSRPLLMKNQAKSTSAVSATLSAVSSAAAITTTASPGSSTNNTNASTSSSSMR